MKRILFLLLLTVSVYGQNPSRFAKIQITGNSNSVTATKVNVQEANGEVNTQTINTGFNKNIGLGGSDVVGANTLLNQYSTTPVDWTATTFDSGQVVFYGGKQWIAKMATVAGDVPSVSSKWEEITFEALANKTVIVDAIPTDGSNNAVSSNGVFDALTTKAPISSVHNPVTLGTANGLSLSNQQLSLGLASSGVTGALSGTDWNDFNGKFNTPTGLTTNYLPKWNGSGFGNSQIFDNGTNIGIGTTTPTFSKLQIKGDDGNFIGYFYNNSGTAGQVKGVVIEAGTNTSDFALLVNSSQGSPYYKINGNGNSLFGTTSDNLVDRLQVNGTISASPATTANQVPTWGQVQAFAIPYKVYTFYVNQSGANIPTSVALNNDTTIGSIPTWERTGVGDYRFFIGTVNTTKVFPYAVQSSWTFGNDIYAASVQGQYIQITRRSNGVLTDGLNNILFEIRQYP